MVVAVVALTAGVIYLARPKGSGPDPKAWEAKSAAAFRPLVADVPELVSAAREWLGGQRSTEQFRLQVQRDSRDFARTRQQVSNLKPSPKAPETGQLYEHSVELYVEVVRTYDAMLSVPDGDVRAQLDLLARRVRELADRVFDRGRAAMAPYLDQSNSKDVDIRLPEEVPIWPDEGLAVGPPLDDKPETTAVSPPLRQASRPQQAEAAWREDVRAAGPPSAAELRAAIEHHDRSELQTLGRRFVDATERLRERPDPRGGRERGATVRLAFLVDADAARAAQAATFLTGAGERDLHAEGTALASVGSTLLHQAGL